MTANDPSRSSGGRHPSRPDVGPARIADLEEVAALAVVRHQHPGNGIAAEDDDAARDRPLGFLEIGGPAAGRLVQERQRLAADPDLGRRPETGDPRADVEGGASCRSSGRTSPRAGSKGAERLMRMRRGWLREIGKMRAWKRFAAVISARPGSMPFRTSSS
ncbi:hypothetical protein [Novosphingobium sp. ST904]|uniref:hypothetical protein n=1 Tax=Novosphingobium sp. ST904 TaxID=1684385 RepID=UPI0006C88070|nr:hypothetical protein [Novosphingobium sp. ST904]KPH58105.1 hypothetical protein ADT71_26730 [Novosphingobium sp. ST904]